MSAPTTPAGLPAQPLRVTRPGAMPLLATRCAAVLALVVSLAAGPAAGRAQSDAAPGASPDPTEAFLRQHDLTALLETYLLDRAARAQGDDRRQRFDRLGAYYVQRLAADIDESERARLLDASTDLLAQAGPDEALELRIGLAIARYRPAEAVAERARLLLADDAEVALADATLAEVAQAFADLGLQLDREVTYQERRQNAASVREPGSALPELSDARRQRSLTKYYAAWSWLYLGQLRNDASLAERALDQFAWVLDTPDEAPSLDRLPRSLLRLEHVARSAIGVAMSLSASGDHDAALAWLDAIELATEGDEALASQIFSRRLPILASAGRWEDYLLRVRARRTRADRDHPLDVIEARLVVVLALTGVNHRTTPEPDKAHARSAAALALGDLVRLTELDQILDLAQRFPALPLEGQGFVVDFIQGTQLFDQARERHAASSEPPHAPAQSASLRGLYHAAGTRLQAAVDEPDAAAFAQQRSRAAYQAGLCAYYAADFAQAVPRFLSAESIASDDAQRERALWMAIVTTDESDDPSAASAQQRLTLARRYLSQHPRGSRAAALLLRSMGADLVPEHDAIEILRAVPPTDALAPAARRQLATLLYRRVRRETDARREAIAREFLDVAASLATEDAAASTGPSADSALTRARQVLDIALLLDPPDIAIAQSSLETALRLAGPSPSPEVRDELTLRRVQLALAQGREDEAAAILPSFTAPDALHARAAVEILFTRARSDWLAQPSAAAATRTVRYGQLALETAGPDRRDQAADATAQAAAWLWEHSQNTDMRDLAIRLDLEAVDADRLTLPRLRRLAELAEHAHRDELATRAWLLTMSAVPAGEEPWFEARYHSARLLSRTNPIAARDALTQLRVLYPSLGPEPWASQSAALEASLSATTPDDAP